MNNAAENFTALTERLSAHAFGNISVVILKGTMNYTLAFEKHWIKSKQEQTRNLNIVATYAGIGSV